jgi:hypothetical protein
LPEAIPDIPFIYLFFRIHVMAGIQSRSDAESVKTFEENLIHASQEMAPVSMVNHL